MTRRQSIANDFITKAKTIVTANGYLTDFAESEISHWLERALGKDDKRYLNIKDMDGEGTASNGFYEAIKIRIEIGGIPKNINDGKDVHTMITNMIHDVKKMVHSNISFFENKYGYWVIVAFDEDIEPNFDKSTEMAEGWVEFTITHRVNNKWTPDNKTDY